MGRHRQKLCQSCQQPAPVLYRVRTDEADWHFRCDRCITEAQAQPGYTYGGTWKAQKA